MVKDYSLYTENVQLRLLIQSYRKLCSLIKVTKLYENFQENTDTGPGMLEIIRFVILPRSKLFYSSSRQKVVIRFLYVPIDKISDSTD